MAIDSGEDKSDVVETGSSPSSAASSSQQSQPASADVGQDAGDDERQTTLDPAVEDASYAVSLVALCTCSLVNAYLIISMFPYAGYLIMYTVPSTSPESVGTLTGVLAGSFMVGRTLTAYWWGRVGDIYGRKFILLSVLLLSSIFSLCFGTATSFGSALLWRFCLGMSNSIVGATKTTATEMCRGDKKLERRAMGLIIGMRAFSYLFSPAIGGMLAEPLTQYPDWNVHGTPRTLLEKYPFMLPNVVGAVLCLLAAVIVAFGVPETLPVAIRRDYAHFPNDGIDAGFSLLRRVRKHVQNALCLGNGSIHGTPREKQLLLPNANLPQQPSEDSSDGSSSSVCRNSVARQHMIMQWAFGFVSMTTDEVFPLFCLSGKGGLGLTEASIGKLLTVAGIVFAACQYLVFSNIVNHLGEYQALFISSIFGIQTATLMPVSLLLQTESGRLTRSVFGWIGLVLARSLSVSTSPAYPSL